MKFLWEVILHNIFHLSIQNYCYMFILAVGARSVKCTWVEYFQSTKSKCIWLVVEYKWRKRYEWYHFELKQAVVEEHMNAAFP